MKLVLQHLRFLFLDQLRDPIFVVTTLIFPSAFFIFFASPEADTLEKTKFLFGSFSAFSFLGVLFFQFALGTSLDRQASWFQYMKSLPGHSWQLPLARLFVALTFAWGAVGCVALSCIFLNSFEISFLLFLKFAVVLMLGGIPFLLMGYFLGSVLSPRAVAPTANMIYLLLSFMGGLWRPPQLLPIWIQNYGRYLPTRSYGELLWACLFERTLNGKDISALLIYSFIFLSLTFLFRHRWIFFRKVSS